MTKQAQCRKCKTVVTVHLRRTICANGSHLVYWLCLNGKPHRLERGQNVSHAEVNRMGLDVEEIPTEAIKSSELLCEVLGCANQGSEIHHWAPRAVFGEEAEQWPKSLLCVSHHQEWHAKMVAA